MGGVPPMSNLSRWPALLLFAVFLVERAAGSRALKNVYYWFSKNLMKQETDIMDTNDVLTLKALELKNAVYGLNSDGLDHVLRANPEIKESMRNICAFISNELFSDVERICKNLSISKRSLIEMALVDIIEKADNIMEKVGVAGVTKEF